MSTEIQSEVLPEAAAPEAAAPEAVAPEAVAPEAVAPEAVAPEAAAPEKKVKEPKEPKMVLDPTFQVGKQISVLFDKKRDGEIDIKDLAANLTAMNILSPEDVQILIKKCVSSKAGELFASFKRDPSKEELHELLNHDKKKKFMKFFPEFCEAKGL